MAKALLPATLLILLILVACSDPAPTPAPQPQATTPVANQLEPTAAPTPQPTETPTTAPSPRLAETSTTAPPQDQSSAGRLTPLVLDDPEAVASQLSNQELACLAGVADVARLLTIFNYPGVATSEEQVELINCLQDETLNRMFLTGLIQDTGALSTETSACVRTGFREIDLRSVMLAGLHGDPGTAMSGGMAALFLTLACLNQEEWNAAAPAMDMGPDDREGMQCLLAEMGGPEGMAAALGAEDQSGFMVLFAAAAGCGLEMGGPPSQVPAVPTSTPPANETVPAEIETAAREFLAGELEVDEGDLRLDSSEGVQWSDASLGCPQEGMLYAQVITPGYKLVFALSGTVHAVHTNSDGSNMVVCGEER